MTIQESNMLEVYSFRIRYVSLNKYIIEDGEALMTSGNTA
jgi:hypothetical protein